MNESIIDQIKKTQKLLQKSDSTVLEEKIRQKETQRAISLLTPVY